MSYDLHFWRQSDDINKEPSQIRDELQDNVHVEGIESLPIHALLDAFQRDFPAINTEQDPWDWEGDGSYFQVSLASVDERSCRLVTVHCGFKLLESPDTMNQIIDTVCDFGCALYDAQTNERYSQSEPKVS